MTLPSGPLMLGLVLLAILMCVPGCASDTVRNSPQDVLNFCHTYEPVLTRGVLSEQNPSGDVPADVQDQIDANNVVYDDLCRDQ